MESKLICLCCIQLDIVPTEIIRPIFNNCFLFCSCCVWLPWWLLSLLADTAYTVDTPLDTAPTPLLPTTAVPATAATAAATAATATVATATTAATAALWTTLRTDMDTLLAATDTPPTDTDTLPVATDTPPVRTALLPVPTDTDTALPTTTKCTSHCAL